MAEPSSTSTSAEGAAGLPGGAFVGFLLVAAFLLGTGGLVGLYVTRDR